jgi:hypothetical protein
MISIQPLPPIVVLIAVELGLFNACYHLICYAMAILDYVADKDLWGDSKLEHRFFAGCSGAGACIVGMIVALVLFLLNGWL